MNAPTEVRSFHSAVPSDTTTVVTQHPGVTQAHVTRHAGVEHAYYSHPGTKAPFWASHTAVIAFFVALIALIIAIVCIVLTTVWHDRVINEHVAAVFIQEGIATGKSETMHVGANWMYIANSVTAGFTVVIPTDDLEKGNNEAGKFLYIKNDTANTITIDPKVSYQSQGFSNPLKIDPGKLGWFIFISRNVLKRIL